jgi:hypothetical protein
LITDMEIVTGQPQELLLIRVTPSQTYSKLRGFRLAKSTRDLILEQNDPEFWDSVCENWMLRKFNGEVSNSLISYQPLRHILAECPNANVRRFARILRLDHEKVKDRVSIRKRGLVDGSLKDPEVRRRFISELRKRGWRMPAPRDNIFGEVEGKMLSERWRKALKTMHDTWYGQSKESREIFVRAWMQAELEAQRRGGR